MEKTEIIDSNDENIENNEAQVILRRSNELLLGAKRIIEKAYKDKDIGKMKDVHDQAVVLQDLAKRRDLGIDLENDIAEIRLYDERKIGELTIKIPREQGKRTDLTLAHDEPKLQDIGISPSQRKRWEQLPKIPEPKFNEEIQKLKDKKTEITTKHFLDIAKEIDKELDRLEKSKKGEKIELTDITFKHGDFTKVLDYIPDDSVNLILTDPPYPIEFIDCWSELADFAFRKLKKNGFCVAYCGHKNLYESMKRMEVLDFYWIFSLIHTGNTKLISFNNICAGWKPILIYQKGFKKLGERVDDVIQGTGRSKKDHDWEQSLGELDILLTSFSDEGDIVVDPFAGSGTVLIASKKLKRVPIGAEQDEKTYNIANKRISDAFE